MLALRRTIAKDVSLPRGTYSLGVETLDLRKILRRGFFLFGLLYFGIWGALDYASTGANPLFWEAALFVFTGHWVSWLSVLAQVVWNGRQSLVRGLFSAGYFYALHEALWVGMMALSHLSEPFAVLGFYVYLITLLAGCLALYFGAFRVLPHRKELQVLVSLLLFDALWMAAGFHVTYDGLIPGFKTQWIASPDVNLTEIAGWIFPAWPLFTRDKEGEEPASAIFAKAS